MGAYICDLELELEVAVFEFKIMWCSGSLDWIAEHTYTLAYTDHWQRRCRSVLQSYYWSSGTKTHTNAFRSCPVPH